MMIMAETAAFDNVKELNEMADDLAAFVQQAAVDGTAMHDVEKGIWRRVLAMGHQATGHFLKLRKTSAI